MNESGLVAVERLSGEDLVESQDATLEIEPLAGNPSANRGPQDDNLCYAIVRENAIPI